LSLILFFTNVIILLCLLLPPFFLLHPSCMSFYNPLFCFLPFRPIAYNPSAAKQKLTIMHFYICSLVFILSLAAVFLLLSSLFFSFNSSSPLSHHHYGPDHKLRQQ
jgi:hypothetical protein